MGSKTGQTKWLTVAHLKCEQLLRFLRLEIFVCMVNNSKLE